MPCMEAAGGNGTRWSIGQASSRRLFGGRSRRGTGEASASQETTRCVGGEEVVMERTRWMEGSTRERWCLSSTRHDYMARTARQGEARLRWMEGWMDGGREGGREGGMVHAVGDLDLDLDLRWTWTFDHVLAATGRDRTGQDRTGQDRSGQDRSGQDWTGLDWTGPTLGTGFHGWCLTRRVLAFCCGRSRLKCPPTPNTHTHASPDCAIVCVASLLKLHVSIRTVAPVARPCPMNEVNGAPDACTSAGCPRSVGCNKFCH
ncbi:uncharacterized protein IWZ02DRAFT_203615 [Phyllosticta citriasiana]|uniref:uncharacterized protein n=1 Tax=Phyllosticta citriasiana TaxID=595635 RepID=UPI0030FD9F5F